MAAVISEKLYVTIQYRSDAGNDDGHLGFASPYTKDAAFKKRKATQDSWAYGYGTTVEIDEDDDVTFTASEGSKIDAASAFIGGWYPKIIKNEPVEGFEIAKSIRRYGWSGSGNVVWRITDPRGFDLEISSDNFASVISVCDMEKGVIKGKCVWGREGSKNILLPEVSEPFQEALAKTKRVNQKVSLKDVQIGDTVDLLTSKVTDDDTAYIYYGKVYVLCAELGEMQVNTGYRGYGTYDGSTMFNRTTKETYLLKSVKTGKFLTLGSPKISSIINKLDEPADKHELMKEVNATLGGRQFGDIYNALLVSDTKFDLTKIEMGLQPTTVDINTWPVFDSYYAKTFYAEYEGETWLTNYPTKWDIQRGEKLKLLKASFDLDIKKIALATKIVRSNTYSYYGSGASVEYDKVVDPKFDDIKFSEILIKYGDLEAVVSYVRV